MYSFICGKEVSVDERKVHRLQRISCFKLAMSDPIWHFIMGYLNMFITYAVRTSFNHVCAIGQSSEYFIQLRSSARKHWKMCISVNKCPTRCNYTQFILSVK